jgi:hypothetical protein
VLWRNFTKHTGPNREDQDHAMTRESIHDRMMNLPANHNDKLFMTADDHVDLHACRNMRKGQLLNDPKWMEEAFYAIRMDELTKAVAELIDNPKSDIIYRLLVRQANAQCGIRESV